MDNNRFSIVFGLTADPIHKGHEQAIINGVEFLREHGFEIEQLLLVPVFIPNLIADKKIPVASFKQRVKMCELVANRLSKQLSCTIQVSQIEKQLAESNGIKNYSYNTIKHLSFDNCLFMVSADHFGGRWPKFRKWFKWQELLRETGILINLRPKHKINTKFIKRLRTINPNIYINENVNTVDISSTEIRSNLLNSNGLSQDVRNFIVLNKLY